MTPLTQAQADAIGKPFLDEIVKADYGVMPADIFAMVANLVHLKAYPLAEAVATNAAEYLQSLSEETEWDVVGREVLYRSFFSLFHMSRFNYPAYFLTEKGMKELAEIVRRNLPKNYNLTPPHHG